MFIEIEIKFSVASHEPLREKLQSLDAILIEKVLETNCILDRPDGYLRKQGCGLRIRSATNQDNHSTRCTLTYKGPRKPGAIKSREEIEINVSDSESATQIMNRLGFVEILWYQKRRESWRLGECRIELDQPPHLGLFVEIEGPDEDTIRRIQADIGLGQADPVQASYVRMLMEYAQKNNRGRARFPLS